MSPSPFEDPAKSELRGRVEIAIDAAGFEVVTSIAIDFPDDSTLHGKLLGDVQSVDGEGRRSLYFLRTHGDKPIPQWIVNLALVAHQIPGCQLYVVAPSSSPLLETSCRTCGAGLLTLSEENTFDHIVDFDEAALEQADAEFVAKLSAARRQMETKLELKKASLKSNFQQVDVLTAGMQASVRDEYVEGIDTALEVWSDWGDLVSARLDEAAGTNDVELLASILQMIETGAILDESDSPTPS